METIAEGYRAGDSGSTQCAVDGCSKRSKSRGLCSAHYERFRKHGSALAGGPSPSQAGLPMAWIEQHVGYEGDECLAWPFGKVTSGYGAFSGTYAHRIMCEKANGPPPTTRHRAAHLCGKGQEGCVNPKHLQWKTCHQIADLMRIRGTLMRGETHVFAKVTAKDVEDIRSMRGNFFQHEIGDFYGITQSTVSSIQLYKNWREDI